MSDYDSPPLRIVKTMKVSDTLDAVMGPVQTKSVYYYIAKIALWVIALTLLGVFVSSIYLVLRGDRSVLGYIISSAQAMSFIAVSVMGYHLSKGRPARTLKNEAAITADDPVEAPDVPDSD